ncbi:S-adenosyl-L-methionine-dependent methyltransferase [Rhizodiscina lignyota]|uniref:S-adenosyl-L-methionine-dependent methyltransferase n=1 Tax=Rhizodiscina lignyota TaxID=1504668 RepID=A0A9P4I207_9PEZI|nr:S-adenosyl-L-methionine-dependent methyltransferase [Rhizodiscina lignyota]
MAQRNSGGQPAARQGPPPFNPPVELLSDLSKSIQNSLNTYQNAASAEDKLSALQEISATSAKLAANTTPLPQRFLEFTFRPHLNAAARIAIEMKLLDTLPLDGSVITISDIAKACNAEEEFVLRIARLLAAYNILVESESASGTLSYGHTEFSRFANQGPTKAGIVHNFDNMLNAQTGAAGYYFNEFGFKSPEDGKNCPFTFAHGAKDESAWDIFERIPWRGRLLQEAMSIQGLLGLQALVDAYPFEKLTPNEDGIMYVDVGGGRGNVEKEVLKHHPEMKGKIVLQDLKSVLEAGTVVPEPDAKLMPYDFFKEVQPVKGSSYLLKWIFHDWPDNACLAILENLKPAMRGHSHSKLLICDLVLPNRNPSAGFCLRDMNMMTIAGKERAEMQWRSLLDQGGFEIMQIISCDGGNFSVIEAVLREN